VAAAVVEVNFKEINWISPKKTLRKTFVGVACKLADIRNECLSYKIYDICPYTNPLRLPYNTMHES
jgi:hypothetical protein